MEACWLLSASSQLRLSRSALISLVFSITTLSVAEAQELKVEFTGKLLGYYRLEATGKDPHLEPVEKFLEMRDKDSTPLLFGMGDNFGPEIGSRGENRKAVCVSPDGKEIAGICDNVANFLESAGYRAIVPGREDFGYTAPWLRDLAVSLRDISAHSTNQDGKINMLAANLRLSVSVGGKSVKKGTPLDMASKGCPLFLSGFTNPGAVSACTTDKSTSIVTPSSVTQLAYLDSLATTSPSLKREVQATYAMRMRNSALSTEVAILLSVLQPTTRTDIQGQLTKLKGAADTLATDRLDDPDFASNIENRDKLAQGMENSFASVCNVAPAVDADTCQYFKAVLVAFHAEKALTYSPNSGTLELSIALPLPAIQAGSNALLRLIAHEQSGIGYVEASSPDGSGKKILVIGVVGRETMQSVRSYNLTLCTSAQPGSDLPKNVIWNECPNPSAHTDGSWLSGQVTIADPILTAELLLRALDPDGTKYESRVLLAQMPKTEAEEMAAHIHKDIQSGLTTSADLDLVISEAQADHASDDFDSDFPPEQAAIAPVLTPLPPYTPDRSDQHVMLNPISKATLTENVYCCKTVRHLHHEREDLVVDDQAKTDTLTKLAAALKQVYGSSSPVTPNFSPSFGCTEHDKVWTNKIERNACELVIMYRLLDALRQRSHADVAFLDRRDFFFGPIPPGYDDNHGAPELQVAMERVLWIDDAPSEVMVSGKDLATIMSTSQNFSDLPSQPVARDVDQQWLQTAGIVTTVSNAPVAGLSAQSFTVSGDQNCHDATQEATQPAAGGTIMYCVNGLPLQSDHAYWVATSDHLVQDGVVYTTMSGEAPHYVGNDVPVHLGLALSTAINVVADRGDTSIARLESTQQQNALFQLDFGKLVVAYSLQQPNGGASNIASNFQGVTDAIASSAPSKSLDVEAQFRLSHDIENHLKPIAIPKRFTVGIQEDFELTGTWTANLQMPTTAPAWSYSANSFTIGPFFQHAVAFRYLPVLRKLGFWYPYDAAQRSLPSLSVVIAPYQFQRNIRSTPIALSGANSSTASVPTDKYIPWGFSQRAGLRYAFDGGKWYLPDPISYAEFGYQYNRLRNVISGLNIDGTLCFSSSETYNQCAATIDLTNAAITVNTSTQNSQGGYWDINLQKGIGKMWDKSGPSVSLVFESKGDLFAKRGFPEALSSQTRFDVPLNLSVTFPVFRNLTLAPTYQAYLYENQIAGNFLVIHNAGVSLRWYMDRDSHVPWGKQFRFIGPSSVNQSQPKTK
jgi:hypothetical protein